LASEGARLALVGRSLDQLSRTAEEARALGADAEPFGADVAEEDEVAKLGENVVKRFGGLDILINNAGTIVRKPCIDLTLAKWNSVLQTNLTSMFLMCRTFIPHMKGKNYGRIINIASTFAHRSLPGRAAYSASKTGVLGLTRALALELADEKITVVSISPGV